MAPAFIDDAAAKTGKGRSTVACDAARGKLLDLEQVIRTSLDRGDELDALATLPDEERKALVKRAAAGEKISAKTEAKKVKRQKKEAELGAKQLALPIKRYGVIVAEGTAPDRE